LTSSGCHVLVDSAMSNAYIKNGNNQQSFHEEQSDCQPSDVPLPAIVQYHNEASQSSLDSQCSSGYCSDCSCAGSNGGSFRLQNPHKPFPKREKKNSTDNDNDTESKQLLPVQVTSPTINDDKLTNNSYNNCFVQNSSGSYENASPLNLHKAPPLPPKPCKKLPLYENCVIAVPNSKEPSTRSKSFPLTDVPNKCKCRSMSSSSQLTVALTHPSSTVLKEKLQIWLVINFKVI